jgi:hypothetical protein
VQGMGTIPGVKSTVSVVRNNNRLGPPTEMVLHILVLTKLSISMVLIFSPPRMMMSFMRAGYPDAAELVLSHLVACSKLVLQVFPSRSSFPSLALTDSMERLSQRFAGSTNGVVAHCSRYSIGCLADLSHDPSDLLRVLH